MKMEVRILSWAPYCGTAYGRQRAFQALHGDQFDSGVPLQCTPGGTLVQRSIRGRGEHKPPERYAGVAQG